MYEFNQGTDGVSAGRAFLYSLLKSFFIREPDEKTVNLWKETIEKIKQEGISRAFNLTTEKMLEQINKHSLDLSNEYYHLFVDPYSDDQIHLTVSMYLEGRNYSKTLAKVKDILAEADIEAFEGIGVPEDYIPFLFEVMEVLIGEQGDSFHIQKRLFEEFLLPALLGLSLQLKQRGKGFYRSVGDFLLVFTELEREYFKETTVVTD